MRSVRSLPIYPRAALSEECEDDVVMSPGVLGPGETLILNPETGCLLWLFRKDGVDLENGGQHIFCANPHWCCYLLMGCKCWLCPLALFYDLFSSQDEGSTRCSSARAHILSDNPLHRCL